MKVCGFDFHRIFAKNNQIILTMSIKSYFRPLFLTAACTLVVSCQTRNVEWVSTTFENPWQTVSVEELSEEPADAVIEIDQNVVLGEIEGFGSCFNELGWASLSMLTQEERDGIFRELYTPQGANFTMGRMPVGANDFSLDYYSYAEVADDFALEHFSIAHDEETLIPFIKSALAVYPDLKLWASPWCPPSWMKTNKHYANTSTLPIKKRFEQMMKNRKDRPDDVRATGGSSFGMNPAMLPDNGLAEDKQIREGQDAFILEPQYLDTYARYFGKFVDAYKEKGIDIFMVMPQNEPNSAQWYPACTWTPEGLAMFMKYLGPEMHKRGVQMYLGTVERADVNMWNKILTDPEVAPYIDGMGFQWAGKDALPELHKMYPDLPCYQTEQECGNGRNDWRGAMHSWDLMKHYLSNGVQSYLYWNTSLFENGVSTWGWSQNSLIVVDKDAKTFRYTPEYYVMKHASHYVLPGAKVLGLGGNYDDALAFVNPDGSTVVMAANQTEEAKAVSVVVNGKTRTFELPAGSLNTIVL